MMLRVFGVYMRQVMFWYNESHIWWRHHVETFSALLSFVRGIHVYVHGATVDIELRPDADIHVFSSCEECQNIHSKSRKTISLTDVGLEPRLKCYGSNYPQLAHCGFKLWTARNATGIAYCMARPVREPATFVSKSQNYYLNKNKTKLCVYLVVNNFPGSRYRISGMCGMRGYFQGATYWSWHRASRHRYARC